MNLKTNIPTHCLLLLIVFAIMITISCSPKLTQPVAPTMDSVIVTNVVHDTSFVIRPDSSLVRALLEADSIGQVHIKEIQELKSGKNIRVPSIKMNNNVLTVTAQVDSFAVAARWNEQHTQAIKQKIVTKTETKTVNHVNAIQKTMMWFGGVFIILIIIGIVLKIKK